MVATQRDYAIGYALKDSLEIVLLGNAPSFVLPNHLEIIRLVNAFLLVLLVRILMQTILLVCVFKHARLTLMQTMIPELAFNRQIVVIYKLEIL